MEENIKEVGEYIAILSRNKTILLKISSVLFVFIVFVSFMVPSVYRSTATILVEQQKISQDLLDSTATTSFADQRIQVISQRVMTTANLKKIIDKFNLYIEKQRTKSIVSIVEGMRENIQLESISSDVMNQRSGKANDVTIAFMLSFSSKSPQKAQQVANELVSLYLNENIQQRTKATVEITGFLEIESDKLKEQIEEQEIILAEFKEKNAFNLPELKELNLEMLNRAEQQMIGFDQQIRSLNERIVYLNAELVQLSPNVATFSATGERIFGAEDRLKELQANYTALSARYADSHPDSIKMRREISALEQEVGGIYDKSEYHLRLKDKRAELAAMSERYSSDYPDVKKLKQEISSLVKELEKPVRTKTKLIKSRPDNPAYIQIQAQLNAARAERASVRTSRGRMFAKMQEYEQRLIQMPQIERKYKKLLRDYDSASEKYHEVKAKLMEANMAQKMEKDQIGERFSLIEPPLTPETPFKPNRPAIALLGFILSIGMAIGYVLLKESFSQLIYGSRELMRVTGAPTLVVIPYIETEDELIKKQKSTKQMRYAIAVLIVLAILLFPFVIMSAEVP